MSAINFMLRCFVALLMTAPVGVYASSWSCTQNNHERKVVVEYTGSASVPCNVVYKKPTEKIDDQTLWSAKNTVGYCEEKAKLFIEKLTDLKWRCTEAAKDTGSYQQSLNQYMEKAKSEKSRFSASDMNVMQDAGKALAESMPSPGIKVGQKAPDFVLNNAFGESVRLDDKLKQGPVILVFYRGAWCPFCNLHLHTLQQSLPEFKELGAQLILVTPQTPDKSAAQLKEKGQPFQVLSDLDSQVMKDYKLYFELTGDLIDVYKKHGLDIEAFNGEGRNVLPVPGSFVIDSDGIVRAMHADTDYKARMKPAAIIEALKAIRN